VLGIYISKERNMFVVEKDEKKTYRLY